MSKKILIAIALIVGIVIAGRFLLAGPTAGLTGQAEEITGIRIKDVCLKESGRTSADYVAIRLELKDGGARTIAERMKRPSVDGNLPVPEYNGCEQAKQLAKETVMKRYYFFEDGTRTRSLEMYLTEDDNGTEYMYLFG